MTARAPIAFKSIAPRASVPLLEAKGLVLEIRGKRLIDSVDLTLESNTRTVIMGPNGAGKSLLLRLLHGLLTPTAGTIAWIGRSAQRDSAHRQAMVFQRPVLLRRSTAANIRYAMAAQGVARAERKARLEEVLQLARLEHLAARPARVLSGGEQQRLAIARALSIRPEILFMDEPTASLDPASVLAIEELIQQAQAAGTKIVLVTHDIGQAKRLSDEVVFMHHGQIVEKSPAGRFFDHPASDKARAFLEGRIVL
jgi:tungstate transport system ATP-binding protein